MKKYVIDASGIQSESDMHDAIANALQFPDYYGRNLDALYDCLTDIREDSEIRILGWKNMKKVLGEKALAFRSVFRDAAAADRHLKIVRSCFKF